jgi:segregation and condensation protein B
MEISQIIPHIEALIFASDKPLTSAELAELVNNALGFIEDRANQEQVDAALEGICEKYNSEFYPFEVKQSGGGWQFLTKKDYYKTVGQLNGDKFLKRLSNASLETLAIIAYKQPITKSEIEAIRGVNCDYAVQKLLEKDLVIIAGRREEAVGHPLIYATSKSFMDYFGINSAEELPKISEVMMEELVEATMMHAGVPVEEAMIADAVNDEPFESAEIIEEETITVTETADENTVAEPPAVETSIIEEEIAELETDEAVIDESVPVDTKVEEEITAVETDEAAIDETAVIDESASHDTKDEEEAV